MRNKVIASILILATLSMSLTGCGDKDEISQLNNMTALNTESSVTTDYNLSWSDEQEMIYAQVSDRRLLDLSALSACSDNEIQQVRNYMDLVDSQLVGGIKVQDYKDDDSKLISEGLVNDNAVIDSKLTDYLLTFMEKTPYYWQRSKTTIRGIDSKSRSIVVDVQYKTIDYKKKVESNSTIVKGDPNYDELSKSRYNKWLHILSTKYNNSSDASILKCEKDFKKYWGSPKDIIKEQRRYTNTIDIYHTGNQKTYKGLIDSDAEKSKGSMTVRYILVPEYVLGINLGVTCQHMYVTDFSLDKDPTENLEAFTQEGYQTVTDNVYNLIYSYFTCMDESDFGGLYKLTNNFKSLDKHYEDMFDSTYQKHQGYSISLFDITGTHITCGVTISTKERAKNSNMTMPVYTDRYYVELELVDDKLQVNNMVLLNRRLEGEPAISEEEVDKSGFTASIDLDNDDKVDIEKLICDFSTLQLSNDTKSDKFNRVVDNSIPTNQLSALKTNMTSLTGAKKVVFLDNYQQGTSNYASVRCKELFQDKTNAIVEAEVTYEFISKGGKWYVYNYDVNSSVKLDTTNLQTSNCLCLISGDKIEAYTSQIKSSVSTNIDDVSDISVSFNHEPYNPANKGNISEQGLVKYTRNTVTDEMFKNVLKDFDLSFKDRASFIELLKKVETGCNNSQVKDAIYNTVYDIIAVYYNVSESRYPNDSEAKSESENISSEANNVINLIEKCMSDGAVDKNVKDMCSKLSKDISVLQALVN